MASVLDVATTCPTREREKLDWSDANVVQSGEDLPFKTGQITKLTKNLENIGVMAEHNLKPTFVARALDQVPIREAHVLSRDNQVKATPWNTYFTECCCPMDSKLMQHWLDLGGRGERVGKENGDMSSKKFVDQLTGRCQVEFRKGNHVRQHCSCPRSPWSKMSRIPASKSKENYEKRLEKATRILCYAQTRD